MTCTCKDDPRKCSLHPYIWEGPNGVPRKREDYSPNKRLCFSFGDLLKKR